MKPGNGCTPGGPKRREPASPRAGLSRKEPATAAAPQPAVPAPRAPGACSFTNVPEQPDRCASGFKHRQASGRAHRRVLARTGEESSHSPSKSVAQVTTDFDADRWFTAPEAVTYDMADEVIGGPAGAPESGTPA